VRQRLELLPSCRSRRAPRDLGHDIFELLLFVQTARPGSGPMDSIGDRPTTKPIHLRFKKRDGASDVTDFPLGFGWLNYTGSYEAYNFLWPYHSKQEKLRAMEKMLVLPGGLRSGWGSSELTLRMSAVKLSARGNHNQSSLEDAIPLKFVLGQRCIDLAPGPHEIPA
jgi:hypothetical protein